MMSRRLCERLSHENITRLARVFCARYADGDNDYKNHLFCLMRGVLEDDNLYNLAREEDNGQVLKLVRMPCSELAPKFRKTLRNKHIREERENSKIGHQFQRDVLDKVREHTDQQEGTRKSKLW